MEDITQSNIIKKLSNPPEAEQTPNHLTIFLANGSTLRFEGVIAVIRTTNKELQSFKYKSMSDGLIKVFNLYNEELIVGISIYEDEKNKIEFVEK